MEQKPISRFVSLGGTEKYLEDVDEGWPVHGDLLVLWNLKTFVQMLEGLNMPVTLRAAGYVGLNALIETLEGTEEDAKLTAEQSTDLRDGMRKVRVAMIAEAEGKVAFVVSDKRHDTNKLLKAFGELLAPGVFDALTDEVRYDLEESGKCIAFERPTAAAFHLMRATEGTLREFYLATVKMNRVDPLLWFAMVDHLRRRSKPPARALLDQLDHIRHNFRNPTQHPDAIYDIQEAQDLLSLSLDAITRLVRVMP